MRILALVPARGGSKRLPKKNIRMLGDKPLILWSIESVKNVPEVCDVLVSSDDPAIASICSEAGALVPWLRPTSLATDTATSVDVALHALDWYETNRGTVDGLLLLQPTSPFRSKETILKGIELFKRNSHQTVLGVSQAHDHPMWTYKMDGNHLVPFLDGATLDKRSQDLPLAYVVNGCFYLIAPKELRTYLSFGGAGSIPLLLDSPEEALDIDTAWDFRIAEFIAKMRS